MADRDFKNSDFYQHLPRFVLDCSSLKAVNAAQIPVERFFEWKGQQFTLVISPACVGDFTAGKPSGNVELTYCFPGRMEKSLEEVLRGLAVSENANFYPENGVLCFSFTQLVDALLSEGVAAVDKKHLEISLQTLANTNYIIKKGAAEVFFRSIEELRGVENKGEFYYWVRFAPIFFDNTQLVNQWLIN